MGPGGSFPPSQAICSSLLEDCFDIVQEIRALDESKNVASSLKPIYDRLTEIRRELESLVRASRPVGVWLVLTRRAGHDAPVEPARDRPVELQPQSPGN